MKPGVRAAAGEDEVPQKGAGGQVTGERCRVPCRGAQPKQPFRRGGWLLPGDAAVEGFCACFNHLCGVGVLSPDSTFPGNLQ